MGPNCCWANNIVVIMILVSVCYQGVISVIMLVSKDIYVLINYTSFVESVFMALSVIGLFVLRYTRPDIYRPIKVHSTLTLIAY